MGCNEFLTKEDDVLIEKAMRGENSGFSEERLKEIMSEIEKEIEERCVECLQENVENAHNELIEKLNQENREPTNIERLDLGLEPTQEELQEMVKVGKELKMIRSLEIIDMPEITGIKDPEKVILPEEIAAEIQKSKIRLGEEVDQLIEQIEQKEKENHLDIETIRLLTKETLSFLKDSKIPFEWRDQATVNMIVFVDKEEPGKQEGRIALEKVPFPDLLRLVPERSRNLYLFQNKEGRLLPETEKERKEFQWKIAHGICHINDVQWGRVDKLFLNPDGAAALQAQLKFGPVSNYAIEAIEECKNDFDKILEHPELRAELFAAWVTNSSQLCPEMKELFDKNLAE